MLPDRVSNPGPLAYESGALPIALRGPAAHNVTYQQVTLPHLTITNNLIKKMTGEFFCLYIRVMTCHFTSFSTVVQSYQDDGWVIMLYHIWC